MGSPYGRQRRGLLFWLVVTTIGGGLTSVLLAVLTFVLLFAILLVLVARLATIPGVSFILPGLSGTSARPGQTVLLTASHVWTGESNPRVVEEALYLASGMYNGPPDGYDTWYHADMIPDVFSCSDCGYWPQGNVQCVALVTAAYALADQPLPYVGNAIDFYTSGAYLDQPGWEELTPDSMPEPGDLVVLNSPFFDGVGHIVIVVDVSPPVSGQPGYVQFVEANGPESLVQEPLFQDSSGDLHMQIWPHYTVMCYIRHVASQQLNPL